MDRRAANEDVFPASTVRVCGGAVSILGQCRSLEYCDVHQRRARAHCISTAVGLRECGAGADAHDTAPDSAHSAAHSRCVLVGASCVCTEAIAAARISPKGDAGGALRVRRQRAPWLRTARAWFRPWEVTKRRHPPFQTIGWGLWSKRAYRC